MLKPDGFPGLPEDWKTEFETFPAPNGGIQLFANHFSKKTGPIRRVLFVVHGQGEHGGRYQHLPHYLKNTVDSVYCLDLRGHGRSEGTRGHVEAFEDYLKDVDHAVRRYLERARQPGFEMQAHLLGHSMGGLICARLLTVQKFSRVNSATLSAPLLALKMPVPVIKRILGNALANIWGNLQLATGLNLQEISRDPAVQAAAREDRLNHQLATPKFFVELQNAMAELVHLKKPTSGVPIQFLVPLADQIVDPQAVIEFFDRLECPAKRVCRYEGFRHESLNELEKEKALGDLETWIQTHQKNQT